MTGDIRREHILNDITHASAPISASKLAKEYHVSRQIIVGDIALLRASGHDILSTARGYVFPQEHGYVRQVAVSHSADETEAELLLIVKLGGIVVDVTVEHPVYGELTGHLDIRTHEDIIHFMKRVKQNDTGLLLTLTHGLHLHRIECKNEESFNLILNALDDAGYLYHND